MQSGVTSLGPTCISASPPLPGAPGQCPSGLCPSRRRPTPGGWSGGGAHLQWEHHQGHADHDDHQQLGRPDLRRHVAVAHRGESDDAEVEGGQEGQVLACSLQVLDATGPARTGAQGAGPRAGPVGGRPSVAGGRGRGQGWWAGRQSGAGGRGVSQGRWAGRQSGTGGPGLGHL